MVSGVLNCGTNGKSQPMSNNHYKPPALEGVRVKEGYAMYGTIIMRIGSAQAQLKTWAHDSIYAFLTDHGYSHDIAADVEGWADLASVGEEYELDGAAIIIAD